MSDAVRMTCFKLSAEVRAAVDDYCHRHGTTITDLYRAVTDMILSGRMAPDSIEGYRQARALALHLATIALNEAAGAMPQTLEEAQARYGLIG